MNLLRNKISLSVQILQLDEKKEIHVFLKYEPNISEQSLSIHTGYVLPHIT